MPRETCEQHAARKQAQAEMCAVAIVSDIGLIL